MIRPLLSLALVASLAACSTPFSNPAPDATAPAASTEEDVPRLSEVDLAVGDAVSAAASGDDEDFVETAIAQAAPAPGGGLLDILFGGRRASEVPANAPDARDIAPGEALAFGDVARVCDLPRSALRSPVAQYPAQGRAQYVVYDSIPNSTAQRPFYITGFSDRCPRQITAALVTLGDATSHETTRYRVLRNVAFSAIDNAYEQVKARVCGVGRGEPCGAQIAALEQEVFFLSGYARFGSSEDWVELLANSRGVIAMDVH